MEKGNEFNSVPKSNKSYRTYRKNILFSEDSLGFGFHDSKDIIGEEK